MEDETLAPSSSVQSQPMDITQSPGSDSGSGSDSESDDEAQTSLQLQALEMDLSTNPLNYDAHLQYITALRKQGDLDKLRLAREAMSQVFPLTPEMWRQWANDEVIGYPDKLRLAREAMSVVFKVTPEMWRQWANDEVLLVSGHESAISTIEKLYERGVSDYLSVSLWCDYLSFIQKYDSSVHECSLTGISKARDLFERALIACGLHVAEGSKIWEAYRSYEEAILNKMNEADLESREKQIQRIRNLFHRQLSIPHGDLTSTLLTYKTWEAEHGNTLDATNSTTDGISPHVASAYQKALDMLTARADFEEQIVRSDVPDTERLQSFMAYTKNEESSGDPARVKSLYERAITEFPISSDLWMNYTDYLNRTLKTDKTLRGCFNRATRNCPWVGELWVRFLLYIERCRGSEKELSDVFERSLQCTFSTIDEYVDIYLTRVDGLRRRFMFAKELDDGLDVSLIRDTFQRTCDYLQPQLENTHRLLQIHSYWARLEVNIGKDLTAARRVWESLLKNSGSMLEAWQAYISMETEMGHIKEARSLYKRCYTKRFFGTGSELRQNAAIVCTIPNKIGASGGSSKMGKNMRFSLFSLLGEGESFDSDVRGLT
ncbi:squamous cell carcinoma antigen recognized by T-cells 3 [Tanacetum coccineum]